jgi:hypothetical protein
MGPQVPLTELTVIEAQAIEEDPDAWLEALRGDAERRDELVAQALTHATRALAARRVASRDPSVPDPSLDGAMAVRVGYGDGDSLVDGRYGDALDLPPSGTGSRRQGKTRTSRSWTSAAA